MNNTIGGFTTDREWVLDKNTKEDITYLDDYAKEHGVSRRIRTIGITDIPGFSKNNSKNYHMFNGMVKRVYCATLLAKFATYEFVTIEKDLHIASKFMSHINTCYREEHWYLDKDVYYMGKENKQYNKESIIFLPDFISSTFSSNTINTYLPLFVYKIEKGNGVGLKVEVSIPGGTNFSQREPYHKHSSKEQTLEYCFSLGTSVKLRVLEKQIDIVTQMKKPPQEWKDIVIAGLSYKIKEYKTNLVNFNPTYYSNNL